MTIEKVSDTTGPIITYYGVVNPPKQPGGSYTGYMLDIRGHQLNGATIVGLMQAASKLVTKMQTPAPAPPIPPSKPIDACGENYIAVNYSSLERRVTSISPSPALIKILEAVES